MMDTNDSIVTAVTNFTDLTIANIPAVTAPSNSSVKGAELTNALITQNEFIALMGVFTTIDTLLSAVGVVSNLINIRTFVAMGADDGLTVSFLFLSMAELTCCLAALGQKLAMALWVTEMATDYKTWFYVNPYAFNSFFGNIRTCLFAIPVFITTYLAVAKCICVVKPLSFKNMFSVARTVRIMSGICVFSLLAYIPVLATMGIAEQFDKNVNATRRVMWFSPYRDLFKNIVWNARDSFPAIASEIVIIVCVVVMSRSLSEAVSVGETLRSGTLSNGRDTTSQRMANRTVVRDKTVKVCGDVKDKYGVMGNVKISDSGNSNVSNSGNGNVSDRGNSNVSDSGNGKVSDSGNGKVRSNGTFSSNCKVSSNGKFRSNGEVSDSGNGKVRSNGKLSGKELQVIKHVTVICVVYVIGNTPKIIIFLAFALVPSLTPGGTYQNLYEVIFKSRENSELLLSVVHIFNYYKYNSKYRKFCRC